MGEYSLQITRYRLTDLGLAVVSLDSPIPSRRRAHRAFLDTKRTSTDHTAQVGSQASIKEPYQKGSQDTLPTAQEYLLQVRI
jgi:hypothetical protein